MMTPQELMDLEGYGNAEKKLRRSRQWKLTKEERLCSAIDGLENALEEAQSYMYTVEHILEEEGKT